jgi:hypothetical protein
MLLHIFWLRSEKSYQHLVISSQKETQKKLNTGLTQKGTKVGVIHELPLRKNKVFSHILRKSYNLSSQVPQIVCL